jgi:hypothetical protein
MTGEEKPLLARKLVEEPHLINAIEMPYVIVVAETAWQESAESLMLRAIHLLDEWGWKPINMTYRHYDVLVALCHNPNVKRKNKADEEAEEAEEPEES